MNNKKYKDSMLRQLDHSNNSIACLRSVVKFYGKEVSNEQLKIWCGTSSGVNSMIGMVQAIRRLKLESDVYISDIQNLKECKNICILKISIDKIFDSYFVFWEFNEKSNKFILGNPINGSVEEYSELQLINIWSSKYLVLIKSNSNFKIRQNTMSTRYVFDNKLLIKIEREDLIIFGIAAFSSVLMGLIVLYLVIFSQHLIDFLVFGGFQFNLYTEIIIVILILILRSLLKYGQYIFLFRQEKDYYLRTFKYLFKNILNLPTSFFNSRSSLEIFSRMKDSDKIQQANSVLVVDTTFDITVIISSLIVFCIYHQLLGILVVLYLMTYILILSNYNIGTFDLDKVQVDKSRYQKNIQHILNGVETLKLFKSRNISIKFSDFSNKKYQKSSLEFKKKLLNLNFILDLVDSFFIGVLMLLFSILKIDNQISIGMIVAILVLAFSILKSLRSFSLLPLAICKSKVAKQRILEFTSLKPVFLERNETGKIEVNSINELHVTNLCYGYPGTKILLKNINFSIKRGEFVIVFGVLGSGKSTLLKILIRKYAHSKGGIQINGYDISSVSLFSWIECLGIMKQDTFILNSNIMDNIIFGENISESNLFASFIEFHGFKKYFENLPNGFLTIVGENGVGLSNGQKQLIGLMRVLWKKPKFLILDEPTSSLDNQTQIFVLTLLEKLKDKIGILVLTSNMDLAKYSDRLYKI